MGWSKVALDDMQLSSPHTQEAAAAAAASALLLQEEEIEQRKKVMHWSREGSWFIAT